jgi:von Willebrand factor type A domain
MRARATGSILLFVSALVLAFAPPAGAAQHASGPAASASKVECAKKSRRLSPEAKQACRRSSSHFDFRVSVERLDPMRLGSKATLRLHVWNRRAWTATSLHVCVALPRRLARVVSVSRRGSIRYKGKSACWIARRLKRGQGIARLLTVKLRGHRGQPKLKRVSVTVTSGNSNPLSHRYALVAAPRKRHRSGAASTSASCTAPSKLGLVFVTDDSESMSWSDPTHLRARAISVGLDQLPDGSLAAGTSFSDFSSELFDVTSVDASTRPGLKLAAQQLYDYGRTDYQEAFIGAQEKLTEMSGADKKAVVFLSDGAPNTVYFNSNEAIAAAVTPIYTIGLGVEGSPEAEGILAGIAAGSGAQFYSATGAAQLQSIFSKIVSSLTCNAQNVSESFSLSPGETHSTPFTVEPSDGSFRALAAWSEGDVTVTARRPDASTMSPSSLAGGEGFVDEPTYSLLTATNPLIGQWQLEVSASKDNLSKVDVTIDVFRKSLAEPPPPPPAPGRHLDPCTAAYKFQPKTKKAFGGKVTSYDRASSLYFVCAGFGAPEGLELTPEMSCALIAAGATFGPPLPVDASDACDVVAYADAFKTGDWAGLAAGQACGYFSEVFAQRVGILAAGAAVETGPGAVAVGLFTYRALSAGLKVACGGLLDGGAQALGVKLEADHETHIALDVLREGRCIQLREAVGVLHWSAVSCS